MFKTLMALVLTASSLLVFSSSNASAGAIRTFFLVSKTSGKCITLKAPDQPDGGGLTLNDCQISPEYFITSNPIGGGSEQAVLQFHMTATKWICFSTTDAPVISPSGALAKVTSQNCSSLAGGSGIWNLRGTGQIEKMDKGAINFTNFCLQENKQTSQLELEVCQGSDDQLWIMKTITISG
jgi:hypothetical protein